MKLFLIRHSDATLPMDGQSDADRNLSKIGKTRLRQRIGVWKRLGLFFNHVLCSPYLRTRQTANLIRQKHLTESKPEWSDLLVPSDNVAPVLDILPNYNHYENLALVTHEPLVGRLAHYLLGLRSQKFKFYPATLMGLEIGSGVSQHVVQLDVFISSTKG